MIRVVPQRALLLGIKMQEVEDAKQRLVKLRESSSSTGGGVFMPINEHADLIAKMEQFRKLLKFSNGTLEVLKGLDKIVYILRINFWISHLLGWLCIAIPWGIVIQQLNTWYEPCSAETLIPPRDILKSFGLSDATIASSSGSGRTPPLFLKVHFCPMCYWLAYAVLQLIS